MRRDGRDGDVELSFFNCSDLLLIQWIPKSLSSVGEFMDPKASFTMADNVARGEKVPDVLQMKCGH